MTPLELRDYLLSPARDGNPAIEAARVLLAERDALQAERDRLTRELGRRVDLEVRIEVQHQEIAELKGGRVAYERELTRLRGELDKLIRAAWPEAEAG
jgi:hypothetical protein